MLDISEIAQALVLLCAAAVFGLALGGIKIRGAGLGIGGVLFAGIAVGHVMGVADIHLDAGVMEFIREFGLILFVYTIGIQVGPGFFSALRRSGLALNALAAALVLTGVLVAVSIYFLTDLELPVVLGLFSGGVTNTPSLGAATQVLADVGASEADRALPGLGYAVAYPFGICGILLSMVLIRIVTGQSVTAAAAAFEERRREEVESLASMDLVIRNPNLDGALIRDVPGLVNQGVVASRMMREGALSVPGPETQLVIGDVLHLVGPRDKLKGMRLVLGEEAKGVSLTTQGSDLKWERLVVTHTPVLGKSIAALNIRDAYGVAVSRVTRAGVELTPTPGLHLQFGDILTAVGRPEQIKEFAKVVGNAQRALQQVQMLPVFLGIALGVLLGSIPIMVPGLPAPLKLGLAGGPLIVAILLSRMGSIGPLVWFMPPSANHALKDIGIILFLAVVGIKSGDRFVEVLVEGDGLIWMAYGALITLIPLLVVGFVAQVVMKQNYLTTCGLLAGSMTDPPALAFVNNMTTSEAPALAYATVYPLVMFLRILAPQIIVLLLWTGAG